MQSPDAPTPEPEPESHGLKKLIKLSDKELFHFVFSNKTASDEMCLELRKRLVARGLRVWQQKTNIPKDSENWCVHLSCRR